MKKEEGEIMEKVLNRVNNMYIPWNIRREIGLSENWQDKISPEEKKMVVRNALKFKEALRKLSKH